MANDTLLSAAPALEEKAFGNNTSKSDAETGVYEVSADKEVGAVQEYSPEQYKRLKRKIDIYLLPLMWLCYGVQQVDKTSFSVMATFGLREDTGLHGQQYSWLATVFYLAYMCFEFPSNILLQRWRMGTTLSIFMICWGVIVLCIGFAKNWAHLMTLRAFQGMFECCISPGFVLIVGSWYTRQEHASRALVFQSANAGFAIIADLILYGIGTLEYSRPNVEAWRYMSYFLGGLTITIGCLCLYFLGTPTEVPWLNRDEKQMANTRILANQSGHDVTGTRVWKWYQVRECLVDPCFYFAGFNAFLVSVPNGGLQTFGSIINQSFGFTSLQVILYTIPRNVLSVTIFVIVGVITSRWNNLRLIIMALGTIPGFIGVLGLSLIETTESTKWTKWGMYFMVTPFVLGLFLAWSLIPSNVPGRTKRTITSSFTFIGYCAGNMCGSQIFKSSEAPSYKSGTIGCCACFGLEFLIIIAWRTILVSRNGRRDKEMLTDGLTPEEREMQGKINGESDMTDFENPHFRYTL
ncbi:MFS general substrate transporter [Armillaria luteobubalina]|uniref:MFS general substrate transporter n=1 Tax=Armillaria luteobubalina TaxID=153913 RepID=A0AA39UUZ7_9AGAR|nr:MFS general substrate transporter [Armillaria luteobubalina]